MSNVIRRPDDHEIARLADHVAAQSVFHDYRERRAANTLRRQDADLALFETFLKSVRMSATNLNSDPLEWSSITWGLVTAFVNWMLQNGYAVGSVNVRLSTVKMYAKLAFKAGAMDTTQFALIQTVTGYRNREAVNVDKKRAVTRRKQKRTVSLTDEQVRSLKFDHPATEQGRRDRFLMCLLLDQGLRISEVALLKGSNFHGEHVTFYRPKVNKETTLHLTNDTLQALADYPRPADQNAPILRWSVRSGDLVGEGITATGISDRVRMIGLLHGIDGLSAHDCRHSWATRTARKYQDKPFRLQEAGGWNSLDMPRRYIEAAKVANEDIRL